MTNETRDDAEPDAGANRWEKLPEWVRPEDQVTSQPATEAPDPEGGRNPNQDWLLRGV